MKIRKNKLKINALKLVHQQGTVDVILQHFRGSYWKTAEYIVKLAKDGYTTEDSSALSDKGRKFLQKVAPRFTL